jgi:hypothetical protein
MQTEQRPTHTQRYAPRREGPASWSKPGRMIGELRIWTGSDLRDDRPWLAWELVPGDLWRE